MTVLLVLTTFLVFIALDYAINRRRAIATSPSESVAPLPAHAGADYVEGFLVPGNLAYHNGHTWLLRERKNIVRVGADEFAAALAGKVDRIELPKPGYWIRQGQRIVALFRNGEKVEMVSPTEGEVIAVNEDLDADPGLLRRDPYGKGWLLSIHVPDEESTGRNLLPQGLVRAWMTDTVSRLYALQPRLAGAAAADGGRPVDDILAALPELSWRDTASDFFLTGREPRA